jgi:hypothetical protein
MLTHGIPKLQKLVAGGEKAACASAPPPSLPDAADDDVEDAKNGASARGCSGAELDAGGEKAYLKRRLAAQT